jgi:prepilin-type processing-associated H-X9-DG protein
MYTDDLNSNSNGDGGGGGGASNLPEELSPITIALSFQASKSSPLVVTRADATNSALYGDEKGFIRQFYCPTQATSTAEILSKVPYMDLFYSYPVPGGVEQGNGYWDRWRISYIYNEGALGWGPDDGVNYQRARGKATNIRQTSKTFFACDGLPAIPNNPARADLNSAQMTGEGFATLYNNIINPNNGRAVKAPVTMADALAGNGNAGDPQCFDLIRHQGKINIGFFDGHVETRTINSKDLSSVYLIAP